MAGMELIEAGIRDREHQGDISPEIDAFLRLLAGWTIDDSLKNKGSEEREGEYG